MGLYELARGIEGDAERLRDRTRLIRDVQEYAELQRDLNDVATQLREVTTSVSALRSAGIDVAIEPPASNAITSLRGLTPDAATLVDAPAAAAKRAIKELTSWASASNRKASQAYQTWGDGVLGDLEGAESLGGQLLRLGVDGSQGIVKLVGQARAQRLTLPRSVSEVRALETLARKLERLTQAVAPTEETREFVRAVLEGGARLDLLTEEVRAWTKERGLWSSLRVRLSGDHGD